MKTYHDLPAPTLPAQARSTALHAIIQQTIQQHNGVISFADFRRQLRGLALRRRPHGPRSGGPHPDFCGVVNRESFFESTLNELSSESAIPFNMNGSITAAYCLHTSLPSWRLDSLSESIWMVDRFESRRWTAPTTIALACPALLLNVTLPRIIADIPSRFGSFLSPSGLGPYATVSMRRALRPNSTSGSPSG